MTSSVVPGRLDEGQSAAHQQPLEETADAASKAFGVLLRLARTAPCSQGNLREEGVEGDDDAAAAGSIADSGHHKNNDDDHDDGNIISARWLNCLWVALSMPRSHSESIFMLPREGQGHRGRASITCVKRIISVLCHGDPNESLKAVALPFLLSIMSSSPEELFGTSESAAHPGARWEDDEHFLQGNLPEQLNVWHSWGCVLDDLLDLSLEWGCVLDDRTTAAACDALAAHTSYAPKVSAFKLLLRLLGCNRFSHQPSMQWWRSYFEAAFEGGTVLVLGFETQTLGGMLEAVLLCCAMPAGMKPTLVGLLAKSAGQALQVYGGFGARTLARQTTNLLDRAARLGACDVGILEPPRLLALEVLERGKWDGCESKILGQAAVENVTALGALVAGALGGSGDQQWSVGLCRQIIGQYKSVKHLYMCRWRVQPPPKQVTTGMLLNLFAILASAAEVQRALDNSGAERVMTWGQVDNVLVITMPSVCFWTLSNRQISVLPSILHRLLCSPPALLSETACCEGSTTVVAPPSSQVLADWLAAARKDMKRRCSMKQAEAETEETPSEEQLMLFETYATELDALLV